MSKECETCGLTLAENDFANHVLGKKHLKKLEADNYRKGLIEKSIYVSRMPPGLGVLDVPNFFSQFGAIKQYKVESNFAIIEFTQKEPVNFLLRTPIWMGRHKLEIQKRKWVDNRLPDKNKLADAEKSSEEIIFADLKTKLESQKTFNGAFTIFLETVRLNEDEVESNWKCLRASLLEALRPSFPHCEVWRFGSTVTGLGFKGSDFDIYLDIGQPIYDDDTKNLGWTPRTIFKEVKCLMYRNKHSFESIRPIPKAKTPIIKFCHVTTRTNCDLSFKNGLGVINSRLIKQLLTLDFRIKPLMTIIKYWSKTFELSGCGKITNYAMVMLIIFYLQQPNVKILPAIEKLRENCQPEYRWNWQVNFNQNFVLPNSNDATTITELLLGFFKFYKDFDFEKCFVCPLDGCAHPKNDFSKYCTETGPTGDHLPVDKPVCLQDPIELDNNITYGVTAKLLTNFLCFCAVGIEVCEIAIRDKERPLLLNLFTTVPVPINPKNRDFHEVVISSRKTLLAGLPVDFNARTDIDDRDKFTEINWCNVAQRLVEEILRRVFKLDVQPVKTDRETKQQKVAATADVHSNDNDNVVLECTGSYSVIGSRKSKGFCIDPTLGCIDKEALVSDELVDKQKKNGVKPTKIEFTCTIVKAKDPVRLILQLTDRGSAKKQFRPLAAFLATKLPSIAEKQMIHMLQYNKH